MTQQLVQEPLVRFFPKVHNQIRCASTGLPLDPLDCFCCMGISCFHKEGSYMRLWNDVKARPWRYEGEDMAWVFRLTPALRRLRRD